MRLWSLRELHLVITRGAAVGLVICFVAILAAIGYTSYALNQIEQERADRLREDNSTLLLNCRRQKAIAAVVSDVLRARLQLEPNSSGYAAVLRADIRKLRPVDCLKLPALGN